MDYGFSTLGCPDWDLDKIFRVIKELNFSYLDLHNIHINSNLNDINFLDNLKIKIKKAGIKKLSIGSSIQIHTLNLDNNSKDNNEIKKLLNASEILSADYIRVFPNFIINDKTREETKSIIVTNLQYIANLLKNKNLKIGLETHGDFFASGEIADILNRVNNKNIKAVWDCHHTWRFENESFEESFKNLEQHLIQVHFKDTKFIDNKIIHTEIGDGEFPTSELFEFIKKINFKGILGVEYETKWHSDDLKHPDIFIPNLKNIFDKV